MKKWTVQEVIWMGFLAFFFGGVFMAAGYLYAGLVALLTPSGYSAFANELLFGMWTMAAPVTGVLIRKKGSAVFGEVLAALAEMLYGSYFGPGVLLSGLIQGVGTELGFIATGYKRYDLFPLCLGAVGTTVLSFTYEFFKFGYGTYGVGMILSLLLVRLVSVGFFGVVLVRLILLRYEKITSKKVLVS